MVKTTNLSGDGEYVIICEHASNHIPAEYNNLGLSDDEINQHIAWDPGALAVAQQLSKQLDAPLVEQCVSRLVYDCNRPPEARNAMPFQSEIFEIPGNANLSQEERNNRTSNIYKPFKEAVRTCLDHKTTDMHKPVVITVHSFTPVYKGQKRDVEIGFLHDKDSRFADQLIQSFATETTKYDLRLNEPYAPVDGVTHTLTEHALPRGLMNVMLEIRNDLISDQDAQKNMASLLVKAIGKAKEALDKQQNQSASITKQTSLGN
ncbi:N-formylglutamate amidohydrolase [Kiloniella spongiae]|uniref:N-formylglutamate amidohydrolase n=1 Tax=Kiloniella spongiae TaxID=1489064 RepID=A0A0H2MGE8_9PROT|nr:N-formylglutamate amidohydrolase [Kiloniella spongiae]